MKKEILFGIESSGGGSFKHVVYLIKKIPKDDFNVTLFYSTNRKEDVSTQLIEVENLGVELIPYPISKLFNFYSDFKCLFFVLRLISKNKYDIIHAHSSKAGLLLRLAGWLKGVKKIYYTPHCFYFQNKKSFTRYLAILYEKIMAKITSKIIVSTNEFDHAIINSVAKRGKFVVINNAISFDEIKFKHKTNNIKEEYKIPKGTEIIIGGVGRLEKQKDWNTYIEIAKTITDKFSNIVFLIVGEGSQKEYLKKIRKENNLEDKLIFTGYVKDMYRIYNIIDIYLCTSLWEGLPYSIIEASMYSRPVISTNSISSDFTFFNESCDIGDKDCLSRQIEDVIHLKRQNLLKVPNETFKNKYSFEKFINNHIALFKSENFQ